MVFAIFGICYLNLSIDRAQVFRYDISISIFIKYPPCVVPVPDAWVLSHETRFSVFPKRLELIGKQALQVQTTLGKTYSLSLTRLRGGQSLL